MAEPSGGTAAPNTNTAQVQLPSNEQPPTSTPKFTAPAAAPTDSIPEAAAKLLQEAREEAAARREDAKRAAKQAADLQARLDKIEADKLAEQGQYKELYEKEQTSRKQAEGRMREKLLRAELRAYAIAEGLMDPDAAGLIPTGSIKVNEDTGDFEGIREAVAAHKEAKPHWYQTKAAVTAAPLPTTGAPSAPTPEASKPIDVRSLSREEYARKKQDLLRSLRGR